MKALLLLLVVISLAAGCGQETTPRSTGAEVEVDPSNPKFMELAWHPATGAVNKLLKEQNNAVTWALVPVKVLKAIAQPVAGFLYTLDIEMAESSCQIVPDAKNGTYSAQKCSLSANGAHQVYRTQIWHFLQDIQVINITKIE